jgi:FtsH-binding integral membrane protein
VQYAQTVQVEPSYQQQQQMVYAQQQYAEQQYAAQQYAAQQEYARQQQEYAAAQQAYQQQLAQYQAQQAQLAQQQQQYQVESHGLAGLIARGSNVGHYDQATQQQQQAQSPYPQYNQQQYPQQYAQQQQPPVYQQPVAAAGFGTFLSNDKTEGRSIKGADATSGRSDRKRFIRLTYIHLFFAMLAFATLSWMFQTIDPLRELISDPFFNFATATRFNWGIVLAGFMAVSWVADYWASHARSRGMQYMGLLLYVIAEAVIFIPLLLLVELKTQSILARGGAEPHILRDSAFVTIGIFGALTASVFITKKDFSFMRSGLAMASGAALMLIVMSLMFGFSLGLVFSIAMVLLAAGYILYQTSQVLAHYDPESHVAASLALFSSVALMFWYIIRIFMRMRQ